MFRSRAAATLWLAYRKTQCSQSLVICPTASMNTLPRRWMAASWRAARQRPQQPFRLTAGGQRKRSTDKHSQIQAYGRGTLVD
jgi:hypothetical protein